MNWLNLETNELRAPEFLGATALERGVWVSLLLHCVAVENGGRIVGAAWWSARQWLTVCGLEPEEVLETESGLWKVEEEDVVVWGYPHDLQRKVDVSRENGRKGGRPSKDKTRSETRPETQQKPGSKPNKNPAETQPETIKKGKGKVREEKDKGILPGAGAPAEEELPLALEVESELPQELSWSPETGWLGVTADLVGELGQAFPACDIRRQLLSMEQWLKGNPSKARKSNWRRFVTNWLMREQDKGGDLRASSQGFGQKKNEGGGAAGSDGLQGGGSSLPPEGWEFAMQAIYGAAWEECAPSWPAMTPQDQAQVRAWVAKKMGPGARKVAKQEGRVA